MNIRFVITQLGLLLLVLSGMIVLVALWEAMEVRTGQASEWAAFQAMTVTACIGLTAGAMLWWFARGGSTLLGRREALLLVALSWLIGAALSALPFWAWAHFDADIANSQHPFTRFVDCYFESVSGLTTTGASVLSDIEVMPRGLLLWRAMTHWLGGLGIVVLFVAVLPSLGVGGKKLFQVEAPGPTAPGVRPRIRETARILWLIYVGMTLLQVLLLRVFGMTWFDAICHTFATLATGGFSTKNASVGYYDSVSIQIVIIIFMVLAGANFGLYYHIIRGRLRQALTDPELRLYLSILLVSSIIITIFLIDNQLHITGRHTTFESETAAMGESALHASFQAVSIQTTTGFATADFNRWSFVPKAILVALMFIGASAGSTGGGIKVIRVLVMFKILAAEIERVFRPNVVRAVRVGKAVIDPELRQATLVYVISIFLLFITGAVLLQIFEMHRHDVSFTTSATAAAATLNNIGPGLELVGAVENYGWFTAPSKLVMCLLMVLGRLEVYAILVLFLPRFWKNE